jgi:hypothetical protein
MRGRVGASGRDAGEVPDGVIQASAPPHIIESGIPTEALWLRSPSPNMPMVCRCIGSKPSMRGIRSSWTVR